MRFWIVFFFIVVTATSSLAKGPTYFKATARNGDGAYSLLRRYHLLEHQDNIQKFFELNRLPYNAHLTKGRTYLLPVLIFDYDGKSIRSTIGVDNWDLAVRISEWNKNLTRQGLRNQHYEDNGELWVPMHEILSTAVATPTPEEAERNVSEFASVAVEEKLPVILNVPLFGKDHAEVSIKSNDLSGRVFYLVSGHGGPDPGAISEWNGEQLCEDEYAYDVTLRLAKRLMENGATVEVIVQDPDDGIRSESVLECDQEELCLGEKKIPLWQKTRLQQRTHAINKLHKQYLKDGIKDHTVICIHVDSRSPQRRQDVFFYYCEKSSSGRELAYRLQNVFKEKYAQYRPHRGYHGTVSSRQLYVLGQTNPTAVYVELANIRNAADRQRILPERNRQALANWLYEGLTR